MTTTAATRTVRLDTPIDVQLTWSALRHGGGDPTYRRVDGSIWRTSRMASGPVTVHVTQESDRLVRAAAWGPGADELLDGLPAALGTEDDVTGFSTAHPAIADAFRRFPGMRIPRTGRVLEALIPAVLEQRVVGLDAQTAWRRLVLKHGEPAPGPAGENLRVVPDAATWAALPVWEWHGAGVDPQRYRTAQVCARVGPQLERVAAAGDLTATYRARHSVPGVGVWTAAETGSRALGDADAVPFGDFHLAHLVGVGLLGRRLHTDDEVAEVLEPYRPQRFRAVRLLALSPLVRMQRRGPRAPRVDNRHL
jgi:3-methyladenine DNA glycosylase/8-oxoguanine DNA glycosylase